MSNTDRGVCIHDTEVPLPEIAVQLYEKNGCQMKNFDNFGTDPLLEFQHLQVIRDIEYKSRNPSFVTIFNETVNNKPNSFSNAVISFIILTTHLSPSTCKE